MKTEDELSFRPYKGANGVDLTWTLGKMIQFITGDIPIQVKIPRRDIMKNHRSNQAATMRETADHWDEMLWDYLSMVCSLQTGANPGGENERILRLEKLACIAAATATSLRAEADEMDRVVAATSAENVDEKEDLVRRLALEEAQISRLKEAEKLIIATAKVLDGPKDKMEMERLLKGEVMETIKTVLATVKSSPLPPASAPPAPPTPTVTARSSLE